METAPPLPRRKGAPQPRSIRLIGNSSSIASMPAVSARNTARRFRPCCQQIVASRAVVITPTDKLITLSMLSKGTFRPAGLASHTPSPADATHTVAIPADVLVIGTKLSIPGIARLDFEGMLGGLAPGDAPAGVTRGSRRRAARLLVA